MEWICINGKFLEKEKAFIQHDDQSFRYGYGLFETIKLRQGKLQLWPLHVKRLMHGIAILKIVPPSFFTTEKLTDEIINCCRKNKLEDNARVRLSISGGNGGVFDGNDKMNYLIECYPLTEAGDTLNENGLVTGVFKDAVKAIDKFCNLKSANYLPYMMAAKFAKENKWNDVVVLNNKGNIADTTITNIFFIKDEMVFTPALTEGCIAGVMRENLLRLLQQNNFAVKETAVTINDLLQADEIFLTNAIRGVRWVKEFESKKYQNTLTQKIFKLTQQTI